MGSLILTEKYWLPLALALMFCLVLSTSFIQSALAEVKEDPDWSFDESAYAYVWGAYVRLYFYEEYHYGSVICDPEVGQYGTPFTMFEGVGPEPYYKCHDLQPGEFKELTKYNSVIAVKTTTYSGYSEEASLSTAEAFITILVP